MASTRRIEDWRPHLLAGSSRCCELHDAYRIYLDLLYREFLEETKAVFDTGARVDEHTRVDERDGYALGVKTA